MKLLEDSSGNTSSMRVAMLMAVSTGCGLGIAGAVAVFHRISEGIMLATIGAGMVLGAQGWKATQTKYERPSIEIRGKE